MSHLATMNQLADSATRSDASNHSTVSDTHSATAPASPASSALSSPAPSTPSTPLSSTAQLSSTSASTPVSQPSPSNPLALPSSSSSATCTGPRRSCLLRLASDLAALESDPPEGIDASPLDQAANPLLWRGCLFGPPDSEWEGAILPLHLTFPADYPQHPPTIRFTCAPFHPNVFVDGRLCLDIVQDKWSPCYTVGSILTSIQSLLTDPNTASPANSEAAQLWCNDRKEYRKRVRKCVAKISGGM